MSVFRRTRLRRLSLLLAWRHYRSLGRKHYYAMENIQECYDCGLSMLRTISSEYRIHEKALDACMRRIKALDWLLDRYN